MNAGPVTISNYARNASRAMYPQLSRFLLAAVVPALAVQGGVCGPDNAVVTSCTWGPGNYGPGLTPSGSSSLVTSKTVRMTTAEVSAFIFGNCTGTGGGTFGRGFTLNDTTEFGVLIAGVNSQMNVKGTSSSSATISGNFALAVSWKSADLGGAYRWWNNGVLLTNSVASPSGALTINSPLIVGNRASGSRQFGGSISGVYIFRRELTAADVMLLTNDPFAPIRARQSRALSTAGGAMAALAVA